MTSLTGQTVSHYRIIEKLGGGGMGVVYKAEDTRLKRTVALKFLPPAFNPDPDAKARFKREAESASALDHPNVCTIYDIDESADGQVFISMAYYAGETLKKKLERSPLSLHDAIDTAIQVACGLQAAHEAGMVHRDIKPANIMVTAKSEVKILDFGLAKLAGEAVLTKSGSTVGTIAYASPEQARGEEVDRRSDIFSLGVVLYEMVTGRRPFSGEHDSAIMYSIINQTPEPLARYKADVPESLQRIIDKSLAKESGIRYQHTAEMLVDLRGVEQGSLLVPKSKRGGKRLTRTIGAVAAALALALLAYILVVPKRTSVPERSVAVLPFQNLSGGGPYAYFAAGLQDELLTQLSKVGALKVISRTSVMGYEGTKTPLRQIAQELGVKSVVEGSVQVVLDRLRVNIQLIDAETDATLWAERYDRKLDDAFAIQSEVAQQVVLAVGGVLTSAERISIAAAPTANAEAYRFYLEGRQYLSRPGALLQNLESAQRLFEQALALDTGFALAHAALSEIHGRIYWYRYDPSSGRVDRQREEAEIALRLAPNQPQSHVAIGLALYWGRRDFQGALDEFEVAQKDLPNDAHLWALVGYIHRRLGNWDRVFEAFEKATVVNPRDANLYYNLGGLTYDGLHRYADAVGSYERAMRLAPDLWDAAIARGVTFFHWHGDLDTLRAALRRIPSDSELEGVGLLTEWRAKLLLWQREPDSLILLIRNTHFPVFESIPGFLPASLYAAWAHRLRGDNNEARVSFEISQLLLDSAMSRLPDDWRVHAALGLTLAGLGHRNNAISEAHWLQGTEVYRRDSFDGPAVAEARAMILAQASDTTGALNEIERLLREPSNVSLHTLRIDPRWDPLRNSPRFQALLAKGAPTSSAR